MNQKLIEIKKGEHYIIVDDSEIKANEWFYSPQLKQPQIYGHDNIPKERGFKKITHSTQPLENGIGKSINGTYPPEYPRFDKIKPLSLSEVEEVIKNSSSENNEWNIYFDKNGKILIMNV